MFIEAISDFSKIDILFLVNPEINYSSSQISEFEKTLSKYWQTDIRIFLCPITKFRDENKLIKLFSYSRGIYSFFQQRYYFDVSSQKHIRALEKCLERKPDIIFAHRLPAMCPLLLTTAGLPPIIFDLDDIGHIVLQRFIKQGNILKKLLYLHLPALYWGEYRAIKLAFRTFVCSERDRSYLTKKYKLKGITTIPNAVTIPDLQPITADLTLLYLGSYFTQNIDAARFLIQEIWPYIHNAMPESRLIIAGITPEQLKCDITKVPGLEMPGFVEDLDLLYKRSRVIATPILVGGGTRIKILEAAAYGKPIVSTTIGAEGIDLENETEILIRDNPKEFADACLKLLTDISFCERIGIKARAKILKEYDRTNVIRLIKQNLLDA
jgi:glycosyltransferase involved in cell wall biosynthesis